MPEREVLDTMMSARSLDHSTKHSIKMMKASSILSPTKTKLRQDQGIAENASRSQMEEALEVLDKESCVSSDCILDLTERKP